MNDNCRAGAAAASWGCPARMIIGNLPRSHAGKLACLSVAERNITATPS
jgi:hypothetical protein